MTAESCGGILEGACAPIPEGLRVVRVDDFEAAFPSGNGTESTARRFAMLFIDDGPSHKGGNGEVVRALNAAGEQFALKRLAPIDSNGLVGADSPAQAVSGSDKALVPSAKSGSADEGAPGGSADAVSLYNHEYEMHRRLSGLRGVPRLYGRGKVEGRPVIVMEWVEGEPLSSAMGKMAIDDDGRLSSLAAARLGRDLFDILARMDVLEEAVVHRDVSPRNIVVETAQVSLAEQVEEGVFELRLIDFGSAEETKGGGGASLRSWGQRKGATADYAAPELLDNRLGEANERRRAAAVDVYAATSILYQLLEGHPPFDLSLAVREDDGARTAFRIKTELQFPPICGVHGSATEIPIVLEREPEVAVAVGRAAAQLEMAPSSSKIRMALCQADELLVPLVTAGLSVDPRRRPAAAQMRDALAAFADHYAENISRALRGEPLLPCTVEGDAPQKERHLGRKMMRGLLTAVSLGVCAAVAISMALLAQGMEVAFPAKGPLWEGSLPGGLVAVALLLPLACGLLARWRDRFTGFGFFRALMGDLIAATLLCLAVVLCAWPTGQVKTALFAAIFLAAAAPLPIFAASLALGPSVKPVARGFGSSKKKPVLPWGGDAAALLGGTPAVAELPVAATALPSMEGGAEGDSGLATACLSPAVSSEIALEADAMELPKEPEFEFSAIEATVDSPVEKVSEADFEEVAPEDEERP